MNELKGRKDWVQMFKQLDDIVCPRCNSSYLIYVSRPAGAGNRYFFECGKCNFQWV